MSSIQFQGGVLACNFITSFWTLGGECDSEPTTNCIAFYIECGCSLGFGESGTINVIIRRGGKSWVWR